MTNLLRIFNKEMVNSILDDLKNTFEFDENYKDVYVNNEDEILFEDKRADYGFHAYETLPHTKQMYNYLHQKGIEFTAFYASQSGEEAGIYENGKFCISSLSNDGEICGDLWEFVQEYAHYGSEQWRNSE